MARGGRRNGTPGKAYANRSDLMQSYAPQQGMTTAAAGGVRPAPAAPPAAPDLGPAGTALPTQGGGPTPVTPDQVAPLDAPSARPGEPVTAGIPSGPGPSGAPDTNRPDLVAMRAHLPYLTALVQHPDTPLSVINFVNYLQSQVNPQ